MSRRVPAVLIVLLVALSPLVDASVKSGGGADRNASPFDGEPLWSDSLDDLSHVYVPPGGLVGVEVSGGQVHLLPGHDEGWVASSVITCPPGYRYDLVLLEADLPGDSYVNVSILDASKTPSAPGFANGTVTGYVNRTATDVSVFGVSRSLDIRIQVDLFASGADRPRLLSWSLHFIPLGEWHDEFLGAGKTTDVRGLNLTGDAVELDLSTGGIAYDPYPPVVFPDSRSNVDIFRPNAAHDGYKDVGSIANTGSTRGMDVDDLDGDGNLDLVLARDGNSGSLILWGSDTGTWSTSDKTSLSHTDAGTDAAIGDFDGDGWKDIVISAIGGMIHDGSYVYLNNGDGTFDKDHDIKLDGSTISADAGDLNGDGYDDIVLAKSLVMDAPCYFGGSGGPDTTADLNFLRGITMTSIGEALVEDVDQDGHLDVLFAVVDNKKAPIFLGSASGPDVTADIELPLTNVPWDVSVGDVDDDGYLDIAYSTFDANRNGLLEIFKGTSSGWDVTRMHNISAAQGLMPVELVDIDTDGYDDIVTGDATRFKVYMGGGTWPTAASVSKTGLTSPEDVAVAVPSGAGAGGAKRGYLVTEPIKRHIDMRWDILHVDAEIPAGTEVTVSILDQDQEVVLGYENLPVTDLDLSDLEDLTIHVRLDIRSETNATTPVVQGLLVNWMDRFAWRDQFYGDTKTASNLGLDVVDMMLRDSDPGLNPPEDLLFASLRDDQGYNTRSLAFLESVSGDYSSKEPITFETHGASAVSAFDVDGDGIEDLVFASYGRAEGSYISTSPLFLGSPAGWYGAPFHSFPSTGARDVAVDDLNGDGHADVVFAQERDWQGPLSNSTLFWGSGGGWNATPDLELATSAASGVEAADLNGDGLLDLVFACYQDTGLSTDSMVFLQDANGFCGTTPTHNLATVGARAVAAGDLDGDQWPDLVFANSYDGQSYAVDSYVYWNDGGSGFKATPTRLPTMGATDVKIGFFNGGLDSDIVFANSRNATSGYKTDSYIYINRAGGFGSTPDYRLPTEGAHAVATMGTHGPVNLVFACRNNATGFRVPSLLFYHYGGAPPDPIGLPTVGAMDVLPLVLDDPGRGGYLSEEITPDENDDIGGFHTLRYDANVPTGVSGEVVIIDAATQEGLFRTPVQDGAQEVDLRGVFSYQEHPSVRILVSMTGTGGSTGFTLDDLWLNWSQRVPMPPVVIDVYLTSNTCNRSRSVEVWVNATDEFDPLDELQVDLEHQLVGGGPWDTFMVGPASLDVDVWRVAISPDRFAPLGTYRFRVNVTDNDGLSSGHVDVPGTLEVLPNLPGPPSLLEATAGSENVSLEWREPLEVGDMPIEGYRILRGEAEDGLRPLASVDGFTVKFLDTGLSNGVTYHYAVLAFNQLGNGTLSQVVNATPLGVPSEPLGLSVEGGDGNATLTWEPPSMDGGSPLLGYRIYRGPDEGMMERVGQRDGTSFVDEGLENNVTYYYRVSAYNVVGEGVRSTAVWVVPLGLPDPPEGMDVEQGPGRLVISWRAPLGTGGGAITGFVLYRGVDPDALDERFELAAGELEYTDENVTAGTTYHYAVAAVTDAGEGPSSGAVSTMAIDVAGPPVGLVATGGDGQVTLSWSAPVLDGASAISGYLVLRGTSELDLAELATIGNETTFVDTGVVNDQTYHYAVRALNGAGEGALSSVVEATPSKPAVAPDAPATLTFAVKGGRVVLTWTSPTSDGGSPVTGYLILRGTSPDDLEVIDEVGLVLEYTDDDLRRGRTYYYSVAAKNDVGQGEAFDTLEVKVKRKAEDTPGLGAGLALAGTLAALAVSRRAMLRRRGHV